MMRAVQDLLMTRLVGTSVTRADELRRYVRNEVYNAILDQISVRGLATPSFAREISETVGVSMTGQDAEIFLPPRWLERVDEQFHAGDCGRCNKFVAVPWNHDQEECDAHIVGFILES